MISFHNHISSVILKNWLNESNSVVVDLTDKAINAEIRVTNVLWIKHAGIEFSFPDWEFSKNSVLNFLDISFLLKLRDSGADNCV